MLALGILLGLPVALIVSIVAVLRADDKRYAWMALLLGVAFIALFGIAMQCG